MNHQQILNAVQEQYAEVARSHLSNECAAVRAIAQAFGYTIEDLASLPPQANMGLSCGNPVATAGLREGEVVVDLGCGGGLDVLLAAKRVGPTGKAFGIDMTPDMIERAKAAAAHAGAKNVEFYLAQIDKLPLPDASVDCVISNCVINLVPDKSTAFREILRVLKPGGRIAISAIALRQPLPSEIIHDVQAYVGCIAGAIAISDYHRLLREAGFDNVVVQDTGADLNAYAQVGSGSCCSTSGCCSPKDASAGTTALHDRLEQILNQFNANEYAASVRVHALKPTVALPILTQQQELQWTSTNIAAAQGCCGGPAKDPVHACCAADEQAKTTPGAGCGCAETTITAAQGCCGGHSGS